MNGKSTLERVRLERVARSLRHTIREHAKEKHPKGGVFSFLTALCVCQPNGRVDTKAIGSTTKRIQQKVKKRAMHSIAYCPDGFASKPSVRATWARERDVPTLLTI